MYGLVNRKRLLGVLWGVLLVAVLVSMACGASATPAPEAMMKKDTPVPDAMMKKETPAPDTMMKKELPKHLIAAHFVDSSPMHGEVFRQAPEAIVINFNFNLHQKSSVSVTRDGAAVTTGKATIDSNQLAMRATLGGNASDGLYLVSYKACWPDGSCHDGQFAFQVDSKKAAAYQDMTGKAEVAIPLENLKFNPSDIVVSRGTKVTWTNRDSVVHFVNTDPHPSHNVLPALNSQAINQGQSFSFTFNDPGEWGYHCSAHVPQGMVAHIIVR